MFRFQNNVISRNLTIFLGIMANHSSRGGCNATYFNFLFVKHHFWTNMSKFALTSVASIGSSLQIYWFHREFPWLFSHGESWDWYYSYHCSFITESAMLILVKSFSCEFLSIYLIGRVHIIVGMKPGISVEAPVACERVS